MVSWNQDIKVEPKDKIEVKGSRITFQEANLQSLRRKLRKGTQYCNFETKAAFLPGLVGDVRNFAEDDFFDG